MPTVADETDHYDCFISYNTKTSVAEARLLYIILQSWRLTVWWDRPLLHGSISSETTEAARACEWFIVVWSQAWNRSPACKREFEAFRQEHSEEAVVPVVFYSEHIPRRFKDLRVHRLDRDEEWSYLADRFGVGAGVIEEVAKVLRPMRELLAWNKLESVIDAGEAPTSLDGASPALQAAVNVLGAPARRSPLRELLRAVLSREYSWANALAEQVQALYIDHAPFWFYWGVALHGLGRVDQACARMEKALKLGFQPREGWPEWFTPRK